jgi:hypothetical protein
VPEQQGWIPGMLDAKKQLTPTTDNTVEEVKLFVLRLKKRWPDLCIDCKSVIREGFELNQPSKQNDLPHFVGASDLLYQKEKDSATDNGDQSKSEADDVHTGAVYDNEE